MIVVSLVGCLFDLLVCCWVVVCCVCVSLDCAGLIVMLCVKGMIWLFLGWVYDVVVYLSMVCCLGCLLVGRV